MKINLIPPRTKAVKLSEMFLEVSEFGKKEVSTFLSGSTFFRHIYDKSVWDRPSDFRVYLLPLHSRIVDGKVSVINLRGMSIEELPIDAEIERLSLIEITVQVE